MLDDNPVLDDNPGRDGARSRLRYPRRRSSLTAAALATTALALGASPASATAQACAATGSPTTRIGNLVFADTDDSGTFDLGEVGIDGVTVELWLDVDGDAVFEPAGDDGTTPACTVSTSAGGSYWFYDVDPGRYFVAIPVAPSGHGSSSGATLAPATDHVDDGVAVGSHDAVSPALDLNIPLPLGETGVDGVSDDEALADVATTPAAFADDASDLTIDFGFSPLPPPAPLPGSLGDLVWIDLDRNGVQDPAEPPVVGVTLLLLGSDGAQLASTVTAADGTYSFDGLAPGTYSVCHVPSTLPPGLVATISDAGGDDATDSDFGAATCTNPVALTSAMQFLTLDLGIATSNVDLAVTKAGTWSATTDTIAWSIVIRNLGSEADPGSIIVTDILATGLGSPTITTPSGMTCNYDADTRAITCTSTSSLPAGASLSIGVETARTNIDMCNVSNTATVRGAGVDATTANNVATATVTVPCGIPSAPTPPATPTLPSTGGTVMLVTLAAILSTAGYHLLKLSDRHLST